jgi:hypothetical protein
MKKIDNRFKEYLKRRLKIETIINLIGNVVLLLMGIIILIEVTKR